SFRISTDSISFGLMSLIEPSVLVNGIPSTTIYGPEPALIELSPRTRVAGESPGIEDAWLILTLETAPWMACITFVTGRLDRRSFGTEATEPVISDLFCEPYPTTTNSSNTLSEEISSTVMVVDCPTATSFGS